MGSQKRQFRISVRNLVEFLLREGDIDRSRGNLAEREAMQAGSKLHRKIQGQMELEYEAEVSLKKVVDRERYTILLEGRADGILTREGDVTIDEIKGVYRDIRLMERPVGVHLAQAKCYAAIYAQENGLDTIKVQMTYANLETEEIRRFLSEYEAKELALWLDSLLEEYGRWLDFRVDWEEVRDRSIRSLSFPFIYREGQRRLTAAVYRTIQENKRLFIQAPTGVGKTMSVLFPAVRAVGEGLGERIFYLTAKTVTAQAAHDALCVLEDKGLRFKAVFLTAKEKLCFCEKAECTPEYCPYAKGHYDRINEAVFAFLQKYDIGTREAVLEHAQAYQVCPFEMSLDISEWTDGVVGDYNYAFSPRARLKRFFGEGVKGGYLFLIDEAHNLVERGREMFSATLCKEDFLAAKKLAKPYSRKAARALDRCNRYLLACKRECDRYEELDSLGEFLLPLLELSGALQALLEEDRELPAKEELREFYFQVLNFLNISERADDRYVIYTWQGEDGRFYIRQFCIDPSANLRECLDKGNSAVFFSATLLPVNYYKELLSGDKEDYAIYARSPFPPSQRKLLVARDVSSKYTRRGKQEYENIADYLYEIARARPGNYLAFFPSYAFLEEVSAHLTERLGGEEPITCVSQKARMSEAEREAFLGQFSSEREDTLIGLCVMGGIFSEGVDLKEDRLIGAIIVGTGLPMVCIERELLKKYYDKKEGRGFDFAYRYPGMNKVQQAAGRVIRTEKDRGVIALLDERFLQRETMALFPIEWEDYEVCTRKSVAASVRDFWSRRS